MNKNPMRILRPDEYKSRIKQMWGKRASSYDQNDTFHRQLALKLVNLADFHPGQKVLDIACGTGKSIPIT